jgi:hypothetical protein
MFSILNQYCWLLHTPIFYELLTSEAQLYSTLSNEVSNSFCFVSVYLSITKLLIVKEQSLQTYLFNLTFLEQVCFVPIIVLITG